MRETNGGFSIGFYSNFLKELGFGVPAVTWMSTQVCLVDSGVGDAKRRCSDEETWLVAGSVLRSVSIRISLVSEFTAGAPPTHHRKGRI